MYIEKLLKMQYKKKVKSTIGNEKKLQECKDNMSQSFKTA